MPDLGLAVRWAYRYDSRLLTPRGGLLSSAKNRPSAGNLQHLQGGGGGHARYCSGSTVLPQDQEHLPAASLRRRCGSSGNGRGPGPGRGRE